MDRIPGAADLYIGDHSSSQNPQTLQQAHVTHILSALKSPLDRTAFLHLRHVVIEIDDLDQEDVIQHFPVSNAFIREGSEGGGAVLLHCANGQSRSATFLIAYLLSQNPTLTPTAALAQIRQGRPSAEPNPGFMTQLTLYHTMGCPALPSTHPIYQRWLFQRNFTASLATGLAPTTIHFGDTPNPFPSTTSSSSSSSTFRCRRCRTPLATSIYLIPHSAATPCAHLFLQPLSWMRPELEKGNLEGRLECPKRTCGANVGKYAWQGMCCSCGVWVVPGISVARGRVDEVVARERVDEVVGG